MISFRPLIGAEPSPFTAERTKRFVSPVVPLAQGQRSGLASAHRAAADFPLRARPKLQETAKALFPHRAC
jgi:hypothetical protein